MVICPECESDLDIEEDEDRAIVNEALEYMGPSAAFHRIKHTNDMRARWVANLQLHLPSRPPPPC